MNTRLEGGCQRCSSLAERLPSIDESTLLLLLTIDEPADIEIGAVLISHTHLECHLGTFSGRRIDLEIFGRVQKDGRSLWQRQIIDVNSARFRTGAIIADHRVNAPGRLRNPE